MANEKLFKHLTIKVLSSDGLSWLLLARMTSYSLTVNREVLEITNGESPGTDWKEFVGTGLKDFAISSESLVVRTDESGKINYQDLLEDAVDNDSELWIEMAPDTITESTTQVARFNAGKCRIQALNLDANVGEMQTSTIDLEGTSEFYHLFACYNTEALAFAAEALYSAGDHIRVNEGVPWYYVRSSDATPTTFAEAWTAITI
jgi:predicted secreted protein